MSKTVKGVIIDDEKIPHAVQSGVIFRMFGGDKSKMKAFWSQYKENRHAARATTPPTLQQKRIADARREGVSAKELAKKYKMSEQGIRYTVQRVATYQFLNDK